MFLINLQKYKNSIWHRLRSFKKCLSASNKFKTDKISVKTLKNIVLFDFLFCTMYLFARKIKFLVSDRLLLKYKEVYQTWKGDIVSLFIFCLHFLCIKREHFTNWKYVYSAYIAFLVYHKYIMISTVMDLQMYANPIYICSNMVKAFREWNACLNSFQH